MKETYISGVGIWGLRHYQYLKENKPNVINVMQMKGELEILSPRDRRSSGRDAFSAGKTNGKS